LTAEQAQAAAPAPPRPSPRVAAAPPVAERTTMVTPPAPAAVPNPLVAEDTRTVTPTVLDPVLVAALTPETVAAEQYRALRMRIAHTENGRQYRALIVTSPTSGDGKTTTALNLALTMAQEFHKRVLIVDADLRRGRLHELLGLPASPGLSEVLTGEATLEEALVSLAEYHLAVLPAGSPTARPAEMLGSTEMRRVVDILRTQYDRILFDTPPVVALADVGVLAPLVDGVLMVVRAGETTRPAIDRALREVHPAPVLGLVLNDVEDSVPDYPYFSGGSEAAPAGRARRAARRHRS
ncbi:MAG TPA: CpsD/CapB family tyrosine-protein kinase, partial [Vicinamibacterales bacterium]|nr:CpsD/CapB family tyrosine-protein kinase [Vicinamibacterales bacterium]